MKRFNPWPWVPVVILAMMVVANVILIRLAIDSDDGLVSEDWYERSLDDPAPPAPAEPATPGDEGSAEPTP